MGWTLRKDCFGEVWTHPDMDYLGPSEWSPHTSWDDLQRVAAAASAHIRIDPLTLGQMMLPPDPSPEKALRYICSKWQRQKESDG